MRKLAILIAALALASCTKIPTAQKLVGTWKQVAMYYYSEDGERHDVRTFVPESLTFYADGTAIYKGEKRQYDVIKRRGDYYISLAPIGQPLAMYLPITRLEGDNLRYMYNKYEYSFMRRGPAE